MFPVSAHLLQLLTVENIAQALRLLLRVGEDVEPVALQEIVVERLSEQTEVLVEKRLREGTASSAETTYYLRLSGSKARLEKEKLEEENKLLRAKTEMLQAQKNTEELYGEAIKMMRVYQGIDDGEDEQDGY